MKGGKTCKERKVVALECGLQCECNCCFWTFHSRANKWNLVQINRVKLRDNMAPVWMGPIPRAHGLKLPGYKNWYCFSTFRIMHCLINCGCFNGRNEQNLRGADHDIHSPENTDQGLGTKNNSDKFESFLVICPNKDCRKEYFYIFAGVFYWKYNWLCFKVWACQQKVDALLHAYEKIVILRHVLCDRFYSQTLSSPVVLLAYASDSIQ